MKALKNSYSFSLVIILLISAIFTGCTKSADSTSANTNSGSTKQSETSSATNTSTDQPQLDGPFAPFKNKVPINVMREDNPDLWFPEGESIKDNILTKFYDEKLNIKWNIKWLVERGRMAERLDLAIASNDIPDMFEANSAQVYKLYKAGQIQPLGDVYDKYASEPVKESFGFDKNLFFKPVTLDGKIYGLPATQDFAGGIPLIWIREDWLNKLGLQPPKTIDELKTVASAFVSNKMGGNKGTIGIGMHNDLWMVLDSFAHAYDVYPDTWLPDKDGKLVYGDVTPGMKDVLKTMQDFYKAGLFDPEFAVKDGNKVAEDVAAGRCGIIFAPFWGSLWQPQMNKKNDPKAEWAAYPIMVNKEGRFKVKNTSATTSWLVVKKDFKYPEAAVKQYNLWYEIWQGKYSDWYHTTNQKEYNKAQEGFHSYQPFFYDPPLKNLYLDENLRQVIASGDIKQLKSAEARKKYPLITDPNSIYGWTEKLVATQSYKIIQETYNDNFVYSAFQGAITPIISSKKPLTDKVRNESIIKFIMGEPIDQFDSFVNSWYKAGGDKYTEEVNNWYKNNK